MMVSPGSPSTKMGEAFGEAIRSFRGLDTRGLPPSVAEVASLRLFVEEVVANGASLFDAFLRFDLNWRTSVFRGEIPDDEANEALIGDNIRRWVEWATRADPRPMAWCPQPPRPSRPIERS